MFPRKRWKRSAVQHYAPRLAARIARKTLAVRWYTAMHSRTRRPDCPENYGSALLYSRTLPEKTGCDAVNMGFLPGSPPFPASNLASNAKEMGKIKLFPTTEYSSKQASDPVVPLAPCTGIFLGPSKSGKTVALISLILEQYRGVFERIYVFSPSVNIDDGWIPVKKYIEGDLGVNTEREQTYWDEWDEAALRRIIQQQRKITEASKKLEMKKLYQVLVVIDDFAFPENIVHLQHCGCKVRKRMPGRPPKCNPKRNGSLLLFGWCDSLIFRVPGKICICNGWLGTPA